LRKHGTDIIKIKASKKAKKNYEGHRTGLYRTLKVKIKLFIISFRQTLWITDGEDHIRQIASPSILLER